MSKRDRASDTPTHSERTVSWRVCKTFFPMLWQHRHTLAASYFFSLLAVGAVVLIPWPLKLIIDQALIQQPLPGFLARLDPGVSPAAMVIILASAAAVIAMLGAIFSALEKNINARVRERMARDLRDELLRHIQTLPLTLRNSQRSGELGLRLVDDVHHVVRLLTKTVPVIFRHMATMVVIFTVMFWLEPLLGLLGVCVVALLAWFVRHYAGPLRDVSQQKRHYEGEVAGLTQEIIRGMHSVQAQGMEETVRERFAAMNTRSLNAGVEETRVAVGLERVMQITNGIAVALFVGGGGLLVLQNHLTVGGLTVYAAYIVQLLKPVEKITKWPLRWRAALPGVHSCWPCWTTVPWCRICRAHCTSIAPGDGWNYSR